MRINLDIGSVSVDVDLLEILATAHDLPKEFWIALIEHGLQIIAPHLTKSGAKDAMRELIRQASCFNPGARL